jgi:TRAP-type uncharacterized transport system fused permease subunit
MGNEKCRIFYLIPLTVLIFWLVAFLTESYRSLLTLSILLILFTLPHTILMITVMSGRARFGWPHMDPSWIGGLIGLSFGIFGIVVYYVSSRK